MKRKSLIILVSFTFLIALVTLAFVCSNNDRKEKALLNALTRNLNNLHYAPLKIDDSFSEKVFNLYLDNIDNGKRFFTQEDVNQLNAYKTQIDDQVTAGTFEFFKLSVEIFQKRIKQTRRFFQEILAKPFNFEQNDEIQTDPEKRNFPKDSVELKDVWQKNLKFETLSRLANAIQLQEEAKSRKDTAFKEKDFETLEKQAREKVLKTYTEYYHRIEKMDINDRFDIFLNSITSSYDPHTNYFPPSDKANFDISISGKLEGIGATLQESNGFIKIVRLMPGSPSWKQGELQVNDLILKVAQGSAEPVDIVDMRIDDAVKLIRGKKGTEVRLTVKKADGTIKIISIIRDIVQIEETFAKSTIITDKKGKSRFGYIYLPKFYTDFEDRLGRNCSDDVELEIAKLQKDKVDGIILDLRNNGGGSLNDVVKMAGLFIKRGPIVQVKTRFGVAGVLSDTDPRIQYAGPLAIMVNCFSASASEILAAAMQDYKRAVIIGSQTYGKGTVQRFVDLDEDMNGPDADLKPVGSLKLTIQKYYRVNGGSTQIKGVTPDVLLPDFYQYLDISEKAEKNCMPWNSIATSNFEAWQNAPDIEKLRKLSSERIAKDDVMQMIENESKRLKKSKDESIYPLNLQKYQAFEKQRKEEGTKINILEKKVNDLNFTSLSSDLLKLKADTAEMTRQNEWLKDLKKDILLKEAFEVMKDLK